MSHYEQLGAAIEPQAVKYYHGRITREEAERRLRLAQQTSTDGLYLLRDHLFQEGFFALSLFHHGEGITHYVIERNFLDGSVFVSGSSRKFAGPIELVNYYCFHSSGLACRLQHPCNLSRGITASFFSELSPDTLMQEMIDLATRKYLLTENDVKGCIYSNRRPEFEKLMTKFVYQNRNWFHGLISKIEVEKRLKAVGCRNGTFLVWLKPKTSTHFLSLCYKDKIHHYKIIMDTILGNVSIGGSRCNDVFDSLLALVDYHEKKAGNLVHVLVKSCAVGVFGQRTMETSRLPDANQLNEAFQTILRIDGDGTESLYHGQSLQLPSFTKDKKDMDSGRVSNYDENQRPSLPATFLHNSDSAIVPGPYGSPHYMRKNDVPELPPRKSPGRTLRSHTSDYQSGDSSADDFETPSKLKSRPVHYVPMKGSATWRDKLELMDLWRRVLSASSVVRDKLQDCITETMLRYFTRMNIADEEEIRKQYRRGKGKEAAELLIDKLSWATDIQFIHDLARALHEHNHDDIWQELKTMLMEKTESDDKMGTIRSLVPDFPTMSKKEMTKQMIHGQIWNDVLKLNMTELSRLPFDKVQSVFNDMIPGFDEMYNQDYRSAKDSQGDKKAVEWLLWKLQSSAFTWHNALLKVLKDDQTLYNVVTSCFNELHDKKQCLCQSIVPENSLENLYQESE